MFKIESKLVFGKNKTGESAVYLEDECKGKLLIQGTNYCRKIKEIFQRWQWDAWHLKS